MSQRELEPHPRQVQPAPTTYLNDLLRRRWSPRAFAATPVEAEKLEALFEAARWAPSGGNAQPWRFLLTRRGTPSFDRLRDCLMRGNRPWTENVPVLLLSVAETQFPPKGDKPARTNPTALHDLGMALANLTLQATELGLSVHPMAGFDAGRVREAFGVPDLFEPVTVTAVGYLAPSDTLPEGLREREEAPRVRRPLRETVFEDGWGRPAEFVGLQPDRAES